MAAEYPHTHSTRYPQSARDDLKRAVPADHIGGIYRTAEGDIRTWLIDSHVVSAHRDIKTVLAYLDIADGHMRALGDSSAAVQSRLDQITGAVRQLTLAVQDQDRRLSAFIGMTAAEVPAWTTRREVEQGDDMGMVLQSAEALGLVVEYLFLRHHPGSAHDDVVVIDPPAGTLLPRGSTVRVTLNLEG
jgi:hypothetical protein